MATKQKDKSSSKPRQRNRKTERPGEKLDQVQSPKLDPEIQEHMVGDVAAIEPVAVSNTGAVDEAVTVDEVVTVHETMAVDEAMAAEFIPGEVSVLEKQASATQPSIAAMVPAVISPAVISNVEPAPPPMESAAPTDHVYIGMQSIAIAHRNYAQQSLKQTGSLVEKLMSVRSFDQAAEVQVEFARQAYASFISESQQICQLYSRLAGEIFNSWPGLAIGARAK